MALDKQRDVTGRWMSEERLDSSPYAAANSSSPEAEDAGLAEALDGIARDSLRPIALGIGLLYSFLALGSLVELPGRQGVTLAAVLAGLSALYFVAYGVLGRWQLPLRWAHPALAGAAGAALVATIAIHAIGKVEQFANFVLLIVLAGFLLLSTSWLVLVILAAAAGWAVVVWRVYPESSWNDFVMMLVTAVTLSAVIHAVRIRTLSRLKRFQVQNARREAELQRTAQAARESEERFRRLSNATFEGIAIHEQGRILDANPPLLAMFGYELHEIVGRPILDFLAPETHALVLEKVAAGDETPYETIGLRRDGTSIPLEVCGKKLVYEGRTVRVAAVRDITGHKQAEAEREQLIQELDAFAHTVAHDLKNPLHLLLSYAYLLREDYGSQVDDLGRKYVDEMLQSGTKMNGIIDELLVMAEMRQSEVQAVPLDMRRIVDEACRRVAHLSAQYQAEIIVADAWPRALGYGLWVEEVWVNYLSNALKYGGRPPRVEVGADVQPDGMVRFWVSDNGTGLAPEEQARLFAPFTQLTRVRARGYGLGLSIVRRIVEKLNGQVGVESEVGHGSRFYFTLPAAGPDEESSGS
jgi:PAS domain S-box-containing protein